MNGGSPTRAGAGAKTTVGHWDDVWATAPRWRLPSPLNVAIGDLQRVLRRHVQPGMRVLEIGCAPGKMLAWVASALGAKVAGIERSERGAGFARTLFERLGLDGDLRCEDLFATSFAPASFDVVYSAGLIEHFDDPREVVARHLRLARPGGLALIVVPNYRGVYGWLQRRLDPDDLLLHNLDIMSVSALQSLVPPGAASSVRTYRAGRLSPWLLSPGSRWPGRWASTAARLGCYGVNALGLLQPFEVATLCPMLVLEVHVAEAPAPAGTGHVAQPPARTDGPL